MTDHLPIRPDPENEILRTHPGGPAPRDQRSQHPPLSGLPRTLTRRRTQWAVFEPNGEPLWARVRTTVTDFLTTEWRTGMLQGAAAEQAFFVRCDQTTMTQNDLDNGRLNIVIVIAPVRARRIRDHQHRPMDRRPQADRSPKGCHSVAKPLSQRQVLVAGVETKGPAGVLRFAFGDFPSAATFRFSPSGAQRSRTVAVATKACPTMRFASIDDHGRTVAEPLHNPDFQVLYGSRIFLVRGAPPSLKIAR